MVKHRAGPARNLQGAIGSRSADQQDRALSDGLGSLRSMHLVAGKIDVGAGVFKLAVKRAVPAYEGVCRLEYFGTPPVEDGQVELIERGIDDGSVDVVVPIMIWRKGVRKKDTEGAFFRAGTDGVPCSAAGFIGHLQPVLSGRDDGCGRAGAAVRPWCRGLC